MTDFKTESTANLKALLHAFEEAYADAYRAKDLIVGLKAQESIEEIETILKERRKAGMVFDELSDSELEEALDRYDKLFTEALDKFDKPRMDSILILWNQAEIEAVKRGLIKIEGVNA
jgi:hypothetical protein